MESINPEFTLYCNDTECARTDIVFLQLSEFSNLAISLSLGDYMYIQQPLPVYKLYSREFRVEGRQEEHNTASLANIDNVYQIF